MRNMASALCILSLILSPISTNFTQVPNQVATQIIHYPSAAVEPVLLSMIGIAVGLAGIATDVYGMSEQNDLSTQVAEKVNQVTINQIKVGLSPLRKINPKLKKLLSNQKLLLAGQRKLLAGQ